MTIYEYLKVFMVYYVLLEYLRKNMIQKITKQDLKFYNLIKSWVIS